MLYELVVEYQYPSASRKHQTTRILELEYSSNLKARNSDTDTRVPVLEFLIVNYVMYETVVES